MSSFEQNGNRLTKYCGDDPELVLQTGIEYLEDYLFSEAYNLKKITLPGSLKKIKPTMFPSSLWGKVSSLEEIVVDSDNPLYTSLDGVVYSKDMMKLVTFPAASKTTSFVVPETVKEICEYAFQGCNNLEIVTLPEGCVKIGEYAFYHCENLTSINLNEVSELDNNAFQDCHKLQSAELDSISTVEDWAFNGCWGLRSVRFGKVVAIKKLAFSYCRKIESLTFPDSLKTIDEYAFSGRGSVEVPENVEKIGDGALASFQEITIYDNLRGQVSKMGKPYGNATGFSYDVFVKSAEDGSLKYVIPMHSDGTGKMYTLLMNAWNEDNTFDFKSVDRHFKSIKEPHIKTKMSMTRLAYPYSLSDEAKKDYEAYLKRNAVVIVKQFIDGAAEEASFTGNQVDFSPYIKKKAFELTIRWGLLKKTNINELIEYSQKEKNTEWTAFLMDWKNSNTDNATGIKAITIPDYEVGDIIAFGHYTWGTINAPLEWIVVKATKKQYLLLSRYWIKKMPFYAGKREKYEFIGWSRSDVRKWLNEEFYLTSFDEYERKRICLKTIKNVNDTDTEDHIWIPSETESKYIYKIKDFRIKEEELIKFIYGGQRGRYDSEMLRKTWMRYSDCCVSVRYCGAYGTVDLSNYFRAMMWITKE